jgi:hypothetical protein
MRKELNEEDKIVRNDVSHTRNNELKKILDI